jgi:hypothetical protein
MKLPESLFAIINPTVRFLLRSPIHSFWSGSLMLITFTGRKSKKEFTTPVRYIRSGETVRCFTSSENRWWRNLRGGAEVQLRIEGEDKPYSAIAIENNPAEIRKWLVHYLGVYPQDAAYHGIRLMRDKSLTAEDLDVAARNSVVVEASPMPGRRQ